MDLVLDPVVNVIWWRDACSRVNSDFNHTRQGLSQPQLRCEESQKWWVVAQSSFWCVYMCCYLFTRLRRKTSLEPFTWVYQTSWSCRSRHYLSSFCSMVSIKKWKKDLYVAFFPIEFEKSLTERYYPWDSCIGTKPIPSYKAERVKYLPRSAFYHIRSKWSKGH